MFTLNARSLTFTVLMLCLTGIAQAADHKCTRCNGTGLVYFQYGTGTYGHSSSKRQCPICHQWVAAGVSHSDKCPSCNGTGQVGSSSGNRRSNSSNNNGSNGGGTQTYGLTPEEYATGLAIMESQLQGYDGFIDENRIYGKCYRYNPISHQALGDLTNKINELNRCQTGSFSNRGGGVIVFDGYGYQAQGTPNPLLEKLAEINRNRWNIKDVTFSDGGEYWCVLYGDNMWCAYATQEIYEKLNNMGTPVISVALNGYGKYIIVGANGNVTSSPEFSEHISAARNRFGRIKSASMDMYGRIALCCERGVYINGLPSNIADIIKKSDYIPKTVKFSMTGHYLILGENGQYYYWM